MTTFPDTELSNLYAELERKKRDSVRLEIGDGLHIIYDKADTWFAIGDDDWAGGYDRPGVIAVDVEMIDTLIERLKEVKAALTKEQL